MTLGERHPAYEGGAPVDSHVAEIAARLAPGRAVDLGCGIGQNSIWLARQGWEVTAVDIATNAVAGTRDAASAAGVDVSVVEADVRTWDPDRRYDLVISTYALPARGPGRDAALRAAVDAVAPGGTLLIAEFDQSLAEEGWMAERDLVTVEELEGFLSDLEVDEAYVANTSYTHEGRETRRLPVVVVVATRPG